MIHLKKGIAELLENKSFPLISKISGTLGGITIVAMMAIVVIDATGRKFLGNPVHGAYDSVSFLLGLVFFFSLCYCGIKKSHFAIDIVTNCLSAKTQAWISTVVLFVSALASWLLSWQLFAYALKQKASHATSMEFSFLPTYPFILIEAIFAVILGWLFLVESLNYLSKLSGGEYN